MPTYDYVCEGCGHTFELFQSMSAKHISKCPKCKKAKAKRLIGCGAGIIFRGSGFYTTDYRSDGYKKSADSEKPASAKSDSSAKNDAPAGSSASSNSSSSEPAKAAATPAQAPTPTPGKKKGR